MQRDTKNIHMDLQGIFHIYGFTGHMDLQGKIFSKRAPVGAVGVGLSLDPEGRKRLLVRS